MAAEPVDLLVIGSGITGAGVARDAAMRGIHTAIIDKGDFGGGTSSRSSRLVHGGLRYLEVGDWRLVFESSRERRVLLKIAPHLVRPRSFIFPIHRGGRISKIKLAAGLTLYDVMALLRNVRRHRMLGKQKTLKAEPNLRRSGLRGSGRYYDAQCDDARLTLATVRSAHAHGALAANYVSMDELERADGRIRGARVTDRITGESYTIHARVVVNATGPWSDRLRAKEGEAPTLRPTRGVHVAVPRHRLGNHGAVTVISPLDGRVMFVIPWGELSYVGTTDTDDETDPDEARANADDVVYLLRSANALFPDARLQSDDVVSTWAGIRPLLKPENPMDPSSVSREHKVLEGRSGMISVVGGKLTTFRVMARQVVDLVASRLHELDGRSVAPRARTDKEALPGGEVTDTEVLVKEIVAEGYAQVVARHLVEAYGTEAAAVLRLAQSDPDLNRPVVPDHPVLRAELVHAARREMAMTLCDLMMRRTHLYFEVMGHALPEVPVVVDLAAQELGWDGGRKATELAQYLQQIQHSMAFRDDLRP